MSTVVVVLLAVMAVMQLSRFICDPEAVSMLMLLVKMLAAALVVFVVLALFAALFVVLFLVE